MFMCACMFVCQWLKKPTVNEGLKIQIRTIQLMSKRTYGNRFLINFPDSIVTNNQRESHKQHKKYEFLLFLKSYLNESKCFSVDKYRKGINLI